MKRQEWTFEYTAKTIADAAVKKKETHIAKFRWWEKKKDDVMAKIKAEGISVKDSVAASYSNTKGLYGPRLEIDEGLERDLNECHQKVLEHNKLVQTYAGWIELLTACPESRLKLDNEDWLFFFGSDTDVKEEQ